MSSIIGFMKEIKAKDYITFLDVERVANISTEFSKYFIPEVDFKRNTISIILQSMLCIT